MFDLSQLKKGRSSHPPRIVIYGPHGIGKSTFANEANAVFVPTESGLDQIDVHAGAFPVAKTLEDVLSALTSLATSEHDFRAVCIDTIDWLEKLIHAEICRRESAPSMERACGGYGKAYAEALNEWYRLFDALDYLRTERGMAVILLAHCRVVSYANPQGEDYDRYQLDLHVSKSCNAPAKIMEWADVVGFATYKVMTRKDTNDAQKGIGTGERILYLEERPAFQAKNRYSLPPEIPFTWADLSNRLTKEQ